MAINAKIDLKKPVLEEISAQVEGAQCVLLVNYSGLTVAQDTQLRKELREAGVHYKVYKNTMMKRAFAGTAFESLTKDLDGQAGYRNGVRRRRAAASPWNHLGQRNRGVPGGCVRKTDCNAAEH